MTRLFSHRWIISLFAFVLILGSTAPAVAGDWLDPTFGNDGKVTSDFAGGFDQIKRLALQSDGKLVAVGQANLTTGFSRPGIGIARYLPDGALDTSFGQDGKVITSLSNSADIAYAVAIQPDGDIVVGAVKSITSAPRIAVLRYKPNGSLDTTFGVDGIALPDFGDGTHSLADLALQSDGRIVAVGSASTLAKRGFAIVRLKSDGSPDPTFANGGVQITSVDPAYGSGASAVEVLPDGKILAAGTIYSAKYAVCLVRYNADGSLDETFGNHGIARPDLGPDGGSASDMVVRSDSEILVAGRYGFNSGIARLRANGEIDKSFGEGGRALAPAQINGLSTIALQRYGSIIAAGQERINSTASFAVIRFTAAGSLDTTFGDSGVMSAHFGSEPWAMALTREGNIVIGGSAKGSTSDDFALVRFVTPVEPNHQVWLPLTSLSR